MKKIFLIILIIIISVLAYVIIKINYTLNILKKCEQAFNNFKESNNHFYSSTLNNNTFINEKSNNNYLISWSDENTYMYINLDSNQFYLISNNSKTYKEINDEETISNIKNSINGYDNLSSVCSYYSSRDFYLFDNLHFKIHKEKINDKIYYKIKDHNNAYTWIDVNTFLPIKFSYGNNLEYEVTYEFNNNINNSLIDLNNYTLINE